MLLKKAAADLMSGSVATTDEKANVSDVTKAMVEQDVGAMVVLNASKDPVGIFTERDLLNRVVSKGIDPKTTEVSKVMTPKFVCAEMDDDIEELAEVMLQNHFRHLPVVEKKRLVGILSLRDIVKYLSGMP